MPAPAVVEFTAHPGDFVTTPSPWWIQESFGDGTTFTTLSHSTFIYTPGGDIERVLGSFRSTRTDADFLALVAAPEASLTDTWEWGPAEQWTWAPAQHDFDIKSGDAYWPSTVRWADNLYLAWQRITSGVTTAGETTIWWGNLCVIHKRYSYGGQPVDVAADPSLDVREIVYDLMGRGLNSIVEFDPNRVAPGTPWGTLVPHAAWWNGVSAREVLALCTTYAPGMWWAVGAPGISGLPRFEVGRWDSAVRYVITPGSADVELSGGATDLANRALVRYIGTTFQETKTTWIAEVRANVRGLAEAGVHRTMMVDLTSEGLITTEEARRRGIAALRDAALSKTAGRVTIREPIYDRVEGRMVEPWEIQAGSPVIVCDAPLSFGRSTSLTESVGADGISVFRCRGVAYDISSNSATLALDGGSRSLIGRLKLEAKPRRYEVSTVQG